ncbi:hypothetical protein PybrP1_003052, partial [[Pythium] brassicae (nom. inval.)]
MSKWTKKARAPPGYEYIAPVMEALERELREKMNEPHEGKRQCEALWPVHQLNWQRSRYVYDLFHTYGRISRDVYDYCVRAKLVDASLIAKWKKPGYERLCSTFAINPKNYNYGTVSICRVPRQQLSDGQVVQEKHAGCRGCASGPGGYHNIFGNKYGQYLARIQIAREKRAAAAAAAAAVGSGGGASVWATEEEERKLDGDSDDSASGDEEEQPEAPVARAAKRKQEEEANDEEQKAGGGSSSEQEEASGDEGSDSDAAQAPKKRKTEDAYCSPAVAYYVPTLVRLPVPLLFAWACVSPPARASQRIIREYCVFIFVYYALVVAYSDLGDANAARKILLQAFEPLLWILGTTTGTYTVFFCIALATDLYEARISKLATERTVAVAFVLSTYTLPIVWYMVTYEHPKNLYAVLTLSRALLLLSAVSFAFSTYFCAALLFTEVTVTASKVVNEAYYAGRLFLVVVPM